MYCGCFLEGAMSGVGIYVQPNNDIFEGRFYNNKPDGSGSRYTYDSSTKKYSSGVHALWDKGRMAKEIDEPFVAEPEDLPIIPAKSAATAQVMTGYVDEDESNEAVANIEETRIRTKSDDFQLNFAGTLDWKVTIAKYLKLHQEDCLRIGIPEYFFNAYLKVESESNAMDDVADTHFINISALYVSYVYVCSAQKVFESRIKLGGARPATDDFDLVYQTVIDAVEEYNELWEVERENQKQNLQNKLLHEKRTKDKAAKAISFASKWSNGKVCVDESVDSSSKPAKSSAFMSEAERKEEQLIKQQADRNAAILELDPEGLQRYFSKLLKICL